MTTGFWFNYILALLVVALMLGGLYAVVRGVARGRMIASSSRKIVTVLESTALSQHSAVHVVKVGGHYYLLGASSGQVTSLGELDAADLDAWLASERSLYGNRPASLLDAIKQLRGKSM